MLAEVRSAKDAKNLMNLASAAEHFASKEKLGQEAINHAHAIKIQAKKLLGDFLRKAEKNKGAKGSKVTGNKREPVKDSSPTLSDIGITKKVSAESQELSQIAEEAPDEFSEIVANKKTEKTARRDRKEKKKESRRRANKEKIEAAGSLITEDIPGRFAAIVIDPPWDWGDEGDADQLGRARPDYSTMPFEKLLELPLPKLSDVDCHLYLWITNRSLPKGFRLLEAWGFRYVTAITWAKPSYGMGNYFRGQTEHVLFGVKGSQALKRKDASTLFEAQRGKGHSAKPPEFLPFVESCSPGPYLEMFSRSPRENWSSWGEDGITR